MNMLKQFKTGSARKWITMAVVVSALSGCASTSRQAQTPSIEWTWGAHLSEARSAYATTAVNGRVVTVGGTWWDHDAADGPVKRWRKDARVLNPKNGSWDTLPDFPHPVGYALAAAVNNRLYVVGGTRGGEPRDTLDTVYFMDFNDDDLAWRRGPDLPWPASRLRGGVIGSTIYAVSTLNTDTAHPCVLTLDTASPDAQWHRSAQLPHDQPAYLSGTTCEEALYLFGGGVNHPDGIKLHRQAYMFRPESKQWRNIAPLPLPMRDICTTAIDARYILLVGGVEQAATLGRDGDTLGHDILSNRVFIFDTKRNTYHPLSPIPLAVADAGLAATPGNVFIIAGEDSVYRTRTNLVQLGKIKQSPLPLPSKRP